MQKGSIQILKTTLHFFCFELQTIEVVLAIVHTKNSKLNLILINFSSFWWKIITKEFLYFGVENGDECYCGNVLNEMVPTNSIECDKPCSGNQFQTCGSSWRLNLYDITYNGIGWRMLLNHFKEEDHFKSIWIQASLHKYQ